MSTMNDLRLILGLVVALLLFPAIASATEEGTATGDDPIGVGVIPGGGGFYIQDEGFRLRVLGYVQAQANLQDGSLDRDSARDFSVRRARINFLVDIYEDFEVFLELDGAPESRTAMVEARLNWRLVDEALQLRAGKFTSQFSHENARSSRDIDTVERYLALNSMFLLPALDTQFGIMGHGRLGRRQALGWSLGLYNGNSSANANVRDDNDDKEVQARLDYKWTDQLRTGVALNYTRETEQTLSLVDASFNRFAGVDVSGRRRGVGADLFWQRDAWSLRVEGLRFRFDGADESRIELSGGFVQPAWFVHGSSAGGTQLLLRMETARLDADTDDDGDSLYALTAGVNHFLNPNVRLQVNAMATHFDGPSQIQGFDSSRTTRALLTQLQYKF